MPPTYRNPLVTVDVIIEITGGIVLIERKNPPFGWALPGGFVDYGETLEEAACREAWEETSLDIRLIEQLHTYSAVDRDPRQHTVTTVYIAEADGVPSARDDARRIGIYTPGHYPEVMAFDHSRILKDYSEHGNFR